MDVLGRRVFEALSCCQYTLSRYSCELLCFIADGGERFWVTKCQTFGKLKPGHRFTEFFQTDAHLMNEITPTLRGPGFCIVCQWCRAAPDQLVRDVTTQIRARYVLHTMR